jgi:hypothetical protein
VKMLNWATPLYSTRTINRSFGGQTTAFDQLDCCQDQLPLVPYCGKPIHPFPDPGQGKVNVWPYSPPRPLSFPTH